MGVSAAVTMDTGNVHLSSSAHAQTSTLCFGRGSVDSGWIKAWFILFDYPDYSAWLRNKGVRIIEP